MTGMMPDSGVPPQDARNTILDPNTINCEELWYSTSRCQPRFDPAAANAVLSELINAVNCAGIPYDCSKLTNLCDAIRYMIQGGDSWCLPLAGGPNDYFGNLAPPLLAYPADCCMALKVIPNVNNAGGGTRINVNNLGYIPVVRNDGQPLKQNDWIAGIPQLVVYCGGRFIQMGLVPSQMPAGPLDHQIDLWVNNAIGSDGPNNDGLSNTVGHALLTFQHAIDMAFAYTPGPYPVVIHIMNGAGPYLGGVTPIYSGPSVHVVGESANTMIDDPRFVFLVQGPNNAVFRNISFRSTNGVLGGGGAVSVSNGASLEVDQVWGHLCPGTHIQAAAGSMTVGRVTFYANGYNLYWINFGGNISFNGPGSQQTVAAALSTTNATVFSAGNGSVGVASTCPPWIGGGLVTGSKFSCSLNGIINDQVGDSINPWFPGSLPGNTAFGGQYV